MKKTRQACLASKRPRSDFLIALLIGLAAVVPFGRTLGSGFVMDDHVEIVNNPHVVGPWDWKAVLLSDTYSGVGRFTSGFYRPFLALVERVITWPEPRTLHFHLANLFLYGATAALSFLVMRCAGAPLSCGVAASLLFAAHPLHVDVVSPASGLKDLLAFTLALGSLLAWVVHRRAAPYRKRWLLSCCILFFLSLLSKESTVILPIIFLAADWTLVPEGPQERRVTPRGSLLARSYIPVLGTLLCDLVLRFAATGGLFQVSLIGPVDNPLVEQSPLLARLSAIKLLARYMLLFAWPIDLSHDFSAESISLARGPLEPAVLAGAALLCGALAGPAILRGRGHSFAAFGLLAFLCGYVLVSNLGPLFGTNMAPRLFFVPSWGLCVALGAVVSALISSFPRRKVPVAGVTALVVILLAGRTWARCRDWRDDETLFASAVEVAPRNTKMLSNLAAVRIGQGRLEEAEALCRKALEIRPDAPMAHDHLANIQDRKGQRGGAIAELQRAVALPSPLPGTRIFLARLLIDEGRLGEADQQLGQALADRGLFRQDEAMAHWLRGRILRLRDRAPEALQDLEKAAAVLSDEPAVRHDLGLARLATGDLQRALADLDAAVTAQPDSPAYLLDAGIGWLRAGQPERARERLVKLVSIDPTNIPARVNLGAALSASGLHAQARQQIAKALEISPRDPIAHLAMGDLLVAEGDLARARLEYAAFLKTAPPLEPSRRRVLRQFPDLAGVPGAPAAS